MNRLSAASLHAVAPSVRRPAYDRDRLAIGMAHLGVGAFHRCHQAEFTDDMLERRFGDWGVVGINLRPPRLAPTLAPQDGLYTRRLRADGQPDDYRIIGCMRSVIDAEQHAEAAMAALTDPRVRVVTMTLTEKGYCHIPATGVLDESHPDILHDIAKPGAPRSAPGFLVAALERRRGSGAPPLTLVSCDNIPSNGAILGGVVQSVAARRSPDLARWIGDHIAFPSTMVDRIVPASTPADLTDIRDAIGLDDHACVTGEPFRQWVIEDHFAGDRPPWDLAGAAFVADVSGHELIKMRVLNGAQTALCTLGAIVGLEFTFQDASHAILATFARRMLEDETASTLPHIPGMEARPYIDLSLSRLRNSAVRHSNHQIATDGSQKIVQRLLNPIRDRITQGRPFERLACGVAGFIVYLAKASSRLGAAWTPSDPYAGKIRAMADETGHDAGGLVARVLALEGIFGTDLPQHPKLMATIEGHVAGLLSGDPIAHLRMVADGHSTRF